MINASHSPLRALVIVTLIVVAAIVILVSSLGISLQIRQFEGLVYILGAVVILAGLAGGTLFFLFERRRRSDYALLLESREILQRDQTLLRSLIDSIPDLIFFKDSESVYLGCNKAFEEFTGRVDSRIVGLTDLEIFTPELGEFFREKDRQMMAEGKARRNEEWVDYPDGRRVLLDTIKTPYYGPDGETQGLIGVSRDITERYRIGERLRKSQDSLSKAQRLAHIGNWELDLQGNGLWWSDEIFRIFEIDQELFGATYEGFLDVIHPEDREEVNRAYTESLLDRSPYEIEHRLLLADGRIKYVRERCESYFDDQGKPLKSIGTVQDITEHHQAREALSTLNLELEDRVRERTSELQVVNKELESFAYSVSHDLRTPLRAIDGFSLALAEDYAEQLDETALDYLQRVRNGAQRMGMLIDDLLQLSRVNRSELTLQEVDLGEIAEAVIEELRAGEPGRQVELQLGSDMHVHGDHRLLRVMLDNLLGNAWKFTAREAVACITLEHKTGHPGVFFISDNGVGFDMRHAAKLFGAFQRLHRVTDFSGTGVGLATVQRIVHRHGGRIWAEAREGEGATFYFSLGPTKGAREEQEAN